MGLAEQIDAANDNKLVAVEVEEWGVTVYLRVESAYTVEQISERLQKIASGSRRDSSWRAWVLHHFLCDADGTLLYPGDGYKRLGQKSFAVIRRLYEIAERINGLKADDEEDEELKKSSTEPESDSGTDYLS